MNCTLRLALAFGLAFSLSYNEVYGALVRTSSSGAVSGAGKTISDFEIKGLKRIEKEAVLAKLISKIGTKLDPSSIRGDIHSLFQMGYFDSIEMKSDSKGDQVKIIIELKERPVIAEIEFDGNEQLTDSDLKEVLKVKEWSILDVNKIREEIERLQRHYEDKGYFLAKIKYEVHPLKDDEVKLVYRINDYDKVRIKKITFLNNKAFSDEQLKSILMETREGNMLSFLNSSGSFKESAFKNDLQRLIYWYLDHGFVKFRNENPVVTVSDDKKYLYITIYVDEGDAYKMGKVDFSGDLMFQREELEAPLLLKEGKRFKITERNQDIQTLTEKYQDLGYAFVNVVPNMQIREETKEIDVDYKFEKGSLVYFGEINIVGNTKTHDKVIRRELKIKEAELFSGSKMRISKERVERLGYFAPGEIQFNTHPRKGRDDIIDVEIQIKERSTGTITLGAGYGSAQGLFLQAQISEINLLGRGQVVSLQGQYSTGPFRSLNISFTEPYTFDTRWSSGFDLYSTTAQVPLRYNTRRIGMNLRAGYQFVDDHFLYLTYKNEGMQLSDKIMNQDIPNDSVPGSYTNSNINKSLLDDGVLSSVIFKFVRDKRNNRFETSGGSYQEASIEAAGLWGDKNFIKLGLGNRFYFRIIGDFVFRNNTEFGQLFQTSTRGIPPSEKFFLGGPNNMKGWNFFNLSPKETGTLAANGLFNPAGATSNYPVGAETQMFSLFEIEHPLIKEAGLKAVIFYDVGNGFKTFPSLAQFRLRQDAGFGIRWFSPIGPLRFEWGFPFDPDRSLNEDPMVFNFFIGQPF
ncbi:MAG: outer membrane protein assembly factor BamA [Xanthomonadaceae bacterium]|nr:outer membrane protein assembly factor BamA [Xanthomonadaceae bacterium]